MPSHLPIVLYFVLIFAVICSWASLPSDPNAACASAFINGTAPTNIKSPNRGQLVPLCHTKGDEVFFYTIYDSSTLHALLHTHRIRYQTVTQCTGTAMIWFILFTIVKPLPKFLTSMDVI